MGGFERQSKQVYGLYNFKSTDYTYIFSVCNARNFKLYIDI